MPFVGNDGYKYADNTTLFKILYNELIHINYTIYQYFVEKYNSLIVRQKINQK